MLLRMHMYLTTPHSIHLTTHPSPPTPHHTHPHHTPSPHTPSPHTLTTHPSPPTPHHTHTLTTHPYHTHPHHTVVNDSLTLECKGRTVMNDTERYEAVRHCRYVDELVPDAPWTLDIAFLEKHKV